MKKTWKPKRFIVSLWKTIYIMITLIAQYLLVGVAIAFFLELTIRKFTDFEVDKSDRFNMIVFWPIMAIVWIYNFIKGFSNKD